MSRNIVLKPGLSARPKNKQIVVDVVVVVDVFVVVNGVVVVDIAQEHYSATRSVDLVDLEIN